MFKSIAFLTTLVLSLAAQAAEITPQTIQGLPSISSVQVVVDPGPAMAAVQPTAHLR